MTTRTDPGVRLEHHYARRQELLERAAEAEARGLKYAAKAYRRSAAGHLSAYNRIARLELGAELNR